MAANAVGVVDGSTVEVIDLPGQLGGDGRDEIAGLAVFGDRQAVRVVGNSFPIW